jgi:L-alanine-DL-glutamate epimerase-like enolase superfamily enzyme
LALTIGGIAGVTFVRAPENDFDESELPALGLWLGDDRTEIGPTLDIAIEATEVRISGNATAASGAAAEIAANDLYGKALSAALADPTLGDLAVNTRKIGLTMIHNDSDEGNRPLVGFELSLEVEYWVRAADPTALAP